MSDETPKRKEGEPAPRRPEDAPATQTPRKAKPRKQVDTNRRHTPLK